MKAKINLNEIEIKDLDGKVYEIDLNKQLGNLIFMHARTIELDAISKKIHLGKEAEASKEEIEQIIVIMDSNPIYLPFVHRAIINYFNSLNK